MKIFPKVTFIIPTLNADKILTQCLDSIKKQTYPKNKIEIIISDGGSTDNTLFIAKKYNCKIVSNKLKTAEAGKAIGVKHSTGKYIGLVDSDNILPKKTWLKDMIDPLETDNEIIGSEPIQFTYRKTAGFIERYSSLIGANDPYAFISGVYDRKNFINNKWTGLDIVQKNYKNYIKITLKPNQHLPTIGANGTIFRTNFLKENNKQDYLFDIDILSQYINQHKKEIHFAKVKVGIIHTYCEKSVSKFIRKQKRRIIDYFFYKPLRQYNWESKNNNNTKFIVYSALVIPAIIDSLKGYKNKPDVAWFFHPIACQITLYIYIINTLKNKLGLLKPVNRNQWQQ